MTSPWTISAGAERVQLGPQQQGETAFTVTNTGPVDARAVLDLVPGENTDRAWFTVADPQRLVPYGGSVSFLVKVAVPPGTPPGAYWFAGRTYSADAAPEESSVLSNRVTFELAASTPARKPNLWLWIIPAAVLVVTVLGVVLFLVLRDDEPEQPPAQAPPPTTSDSPAGPKTGSLDVLSGTQVDFDEIRFALHASHTDVIFDSATIIPRNGAQVGLVRQAGVDAGPQACAATTFTATDRIPTADAIGDLICVRTDEGRFATAVVTERLPDAVGGAVLRLSITTVEE